MKQSLPLLPFILFLTVSNAQEMESDLFQTMHSSSLHLFWKSEKKTMEVSTSRKSKEEGFVEETSATYRKGKINPSRINFNVKYSEFFVIEDRKKSLGKYEFDSNEMILKYERTDFDNRNQRMYTMYHTYYYDQDIVSREMIRTKEFIGQGSVEQDTISYMDSVIYKVTPQESNFKQDNLSDPGVYTIYELDNNEVKTKTTYFEGFHESVVYTYDSKGHLVKVENILVGEDGNSITTYTELNYDMDGLLSETKFYDEKGELLERKTFTYK